jgi:CRISPR system Cascade subunit CasB
MQADVPKLDGAIARLAGAVAALPPGQLAELRRAGAVAGSATFWRLWHSLALPYGAERWESVAQAIAILTPTGSEAGKRPAHDRDIPFGQALFIARVSETRIARLLALTPNARRGALLRLARTLASHQARCDLRSLARLMLFDAADEEKRRVARDYFAAEAAATKTMGTDANA